MDLRGAERNVQYRRPDLEGQLPLLPQAAEEVEDDDCFAQGAEGGDDAGEEEEPREEEVRGRVDAVEDDGDVGEKFADDVECSCKLLLGCALHSTFRPRKENRLTPNCTQNKFHRRIRLPRQIQTNRNRTLRHHHRTHMMHRTDRANLHAINQLENIHPHQHLRAHHQNIPQRDLTPRRIRRIQRPIPERNANERINGDDKDQKFGDAGDVVVYEAPAGGLVEGGVELLVEALHEEGFEDELLDEEEEDEDDREDEHAEG